MDDFAKTVGRTFLFGGVIFFITILSSLIGALSGWTVSLFFDNSIHEALAALGAKPIELWKLGALVGWAGGFLKTKVSQSKD